MLKHFYKNDKKIFFELLENKEIRKEELPFLYEILGSSKDEEDVYQIYKFLRENPEFIDYDKLSELTGIHKDTLSEVFTKRPVKSYFPVVSKDSADIVTAYIFKLSNKTNKHTFIERQELNNIKQVIENKKIPLEDFFVIFDKHFEGNSYFLSVLAGILFEEDTLTNFAFTGEVNTQGDIVLVNFLEQKKKVCDERGLRLISPLEISNIDELRFFIGSKELDIPFLVLNKNKAEIERSLEKIEQKIKESKNEYSLDKLLKIYSLEKEDLYVETNKIAPQKEEWSSLLEKIKEKLEKIYSSLKAPKITLHIVTSIASLAFGAGVMIGMKRSYVIYHFQNEEYIPILQLKDPQALRSLKQTKKDILENNEFIDLQMHIENGERLSLIIHFASHNPLGDVVSFKKEQSYVYISDKKSQGNLELNEEHWRGYLTETYSVINTLKAKYLIKSFDLFISCPSAMALALGMIVGNYFDINVYSYYSSLPEKYFLIFNTTEIDTPF